MYSYVVIYSNKSVLCTYWGYSTYFSACFVFAYLVDILKRLLFEVKLQRIHFNTTMNTYVYVNG